MQVVDKCSFHRHTEVFATIIMNQPHLCCNQSHHESAKLSYLCYVLELSPTYYTVLYTYKKNKIVLPIMHCHMNNILPYGLKGILTLTSNRKLLNGVHDSVMIWTCGLAFMTLSGS